MLQSGVKTRAVTSSVLRIEATDESFGSGGESWLEAHDFLLVRNGRKSLMRYLFQPTDLIHLIF